MPAPCRRTTGVSAVAVALIAPLLLGACGGRAEPATVQFDPASVATSTTTTTTTLPPTTTTTTTTTTPTTTLPPAGDLPTPVFVPAGRPVEPRIELGRIEIPKLGVNETLLQGISMHTLDQGPGHWPGTALPGGWGNTVVAGHRTSKSKPFRYLDRLVPGDEIVFTTGDGRFVYRVTGTQIVRPTDTWIVNQKPGRTATLFACHPPGSTRQRIVVFAELAV